MDGLSVLFVVCGSGHTRPSACYACQTSEPAEDVILVSDSRDYPLQSTISNMIQVAKGCQELFVFPPLLGMVFRNLTFSPLLTTAGLNVASLNMAWPESGSCYAHCKCPLSP